MLPFITVAALDHLGPTAVFLGSAAILAIVALDVAVLGPRSTGLNLETSPDAGATAGRGRGRARWARGVARGTDRDLDRGAGLDGGKPPASGPHEIAGAGQFDHPH